MVNKLRRKFVVTAMASLLVILVVMIAVINIVNVFQFVDDTDKFLSILATNQGLFPGMLDQNKEGPPTDPGADKRGQKMAGDNNAPFQNPGGPFGFDRVNNMRDLEMPYQVRYFFAVFDTEGNLQFVDTSRIASVSEETAKEYATAVYANDKHKGFYHSFRYMKGTNPDGSDIIVFSDISNSIVSAYKLLFQSLLIGACALVAMFVLVFLFSGRAIAPAVESMEKQKRFITDAGHELKTPLAIISANIDVLELEAGKNEWTSSIRNQVKRMNSLVKNLLTLSRMDEERMHVVYTDFDMSSCVKETAESFEAIAESNSKNYHMDIEEGIHITGDKNAIVQLSSLLLDNAMKYSDEKGNISISLSKGKNITLEVSNTSDSIPDGNLDRLFDRFYRADTSRSREKGGYGIGLSVARAIAQSHGGQIEARKDGDRTIRFIVTLPTRLPKNIQKANAR